MHSQPRKSPDRSIRRRKAGCGHHSYGIVSQVSHPTTHKISYIWARQPLAEISVYDDSSTCLGLADLWHIVGAAAALPWLQTPREARTRDPHALQVAGHSWGPLTEHAATQHEQGWRAVPCSVPMCRSTYTWQGCTILMPHTLPANSTYFCAGSLGRW